MSDTDLSSADEQFQEVKKQHRAELSFTEDTEDIVAHFCKHGKIYIPVTHGNGSLSYLAVMMLDKNHMLVGRHMHGAMVIKTAEDIQMLYKDANNELNSVPADALGLANLLECLYSYRSAFCDPVLSHVKSTLFIAGKSREAYLVRDTIDCFIPYQEWRPMTSVYVAITGVGSWMTPGSDQLSTYSNDYVVEKMGLWSLSKEEQDVHVATLKALQDK